MRATSTTDVAPPPPGAGGHVRGRSILSTVACHSAPRTGAFAGRRGGARRRLGGLLEDRLEPRERPRVLPAEVAAGERSLQTLGHTDGLELVRERDPRGPGVGVGEPIDAARTAPSVLAAAALLDGALRSDALDDRDRDPGMPAPGLRPHARARADAGRALARERPVDEEVIGERLVAREVVEEVEHPLTRLADRRADGDGGHGRRPFRSVA